MQKQGRARKILHVDIPEELERELVALANQKHMKKGPFVRLELWGIVERAKQKGTPAPRDRHRCSCGQWELSTGREVVLPSEKEHHSRGSCTTPGR